VSSADKPTAAEAAVDHKPLRHPPDAVYHSEPDSRKSPFARAAGSCAPPSRAPVMMRFVTPASRSRRIPRIVFGRRRIVKHCLDVMHARDVMRAIDSEQGHGVPSARLDGGGDDLWHF